MKKVSRKRFSFKSSIARSNENGRFDEISSSRVNVDGFYDFVGFDGLTIQSTSSKRNQLGGFDDFGGFSPFSLLHAFLDISQDFSRKAKKLTNFNR